MTDLPVVAYKGFNSDLTCRGFQYTEGEDYEQQRPAELCSTGFHACLEPLDVLAYYHHADGAVYHQVELGGDAKRSEGGGDSKVASKKIKIGAKIDIFGMVKVHFRAVWDRVNTAKAEAEDRARKALQAGAEGATSGDRSTAATSGDRSTAATSGDRSTAATSGDRSTAATSGDRSTAATSGHQSTAATSGYQSTAATSGYQSTAATSGYQSTAATSGYQSTAATSGHESTAATSGHESTAATSGYRSTAATSGHESTAATSGDRSTAATSGDRSTAATSGDRSTAATSGHESTAATSGDRSTAATSGYQSTAATSGYESTVSGTFTDLIRSKGEAIDPATGEVVVPDGISAAPAAGSPTLTVKPSAAAVEVAEQQIAALPQLTQGES